MSWLPNAFSSIPRTGPAAVRPTRPHSVTVATATPPATAAAAAGPVSQLVVVGAAGTAPGAAYAQPAPQPVAPPAAQVRIRPPATPAQLQARRQREERRNAARLRLREARRKFDRDTQTSSWHYRNADELNMTSHEFRAMRDSEAAARRKDAQGNPKYLREDGSIDTLQFRRDRRQQFAANYTPDGGRTYPFVTFDRDGQLVGDYTAYQTEARRNRARKMLDAQGRPRFYDPATDTLDMIAFGRWEMQNRRKLIEQPAAEGAVESVEAAAARTFLRPDGKHRFVQADGSVNLGRYRKEIAGADRTRAERAQTDRRARQAAAGAGAGADAGAGGDPS